MVEGEREREEGRRESGKEASLGGNEGVSKGKKYL